MGNEDLGRHYQEIGDLTKAYDAFSRMRQDALLQKHIADIGRHLVSVAIEQRNWVAVASNTQKMLGVSLSSDEEKALQPLIKVAAGLAHLAEGKFSDASTSFITADFGVGSTFNHIASLNDVAIYGGLCALASMNRDELQRKVLDNPNFRAYLELEPHIRRAISFFVNGRYSACLSILEGYRNDYLLDIYLYNHVAELYNRIRSKSIIQYFIPFSCVTIDSLNEAFAPGGGSIEDELISMIKSGDLEGRIDTQNRVCRPFLCFSKKNLRPCSPL
jgi:COP9 signalosome complex subunit 1